MTRISRHDAANGLITGLTAGLIAWGVLAFLQKSLPFGIGPAWLVVVIPILWVGGVQLGYFLGQWMGFFNQFGKYVAIGFTNFAVDAGVFNLQLAVTHAPEGPLFVVQKMISFAVAVAHSYFWNRRWAFSSREQNTKSEFTKFLLVNIAAMVVNVGAAYFVVHFINRPATASPEAWANLGGVVGAASALIFNFIGLRVIVFKNNAIPNLPA